MKTQDGDATGSLVPAWPGGAEAELPIKTN